MDLAVKMKAAALIGKLAAGQTEDVAVVDVRPKTVLQTGSRGTPWHFPVSTPEAQGVPSDVLSDFLREMGRWPEIGAHAIFIVKNGYRIAAGAYAPFTLDGWHVSHSACKSVTSLAIGILADEGVLRLDETLGEIFPPSFGYYAGTPWTCGITVRELLTMSSGVGFDEVGVATEADYIKTFFESSREFEPGSKFSYNSMNSHMLSAIVQAKTGMTMMAFLRLRLFMPLGITDVFWESSPAGVTAGGWGLYLTIEDYAKLGQLFLNRGLWEGKRIISEEWLTMASSKQIESDPDMSRYGYGFQIWMGRRPGAFQFNGMLGQNVFVIPDENLVVAITAGSSEIFGTGRLTDTIYGTFESGRHFADHPLPEDPSAAHRLQMTEASLRFSAPLPEGVPAMAESGWHSTGAAFARAASRTKPAVFHGRGRWREDIGRFAHLKEEALAVSLSGRLYRMDRNAAGILPLFTQVMHNNYAGGINAIGFAWERGRLSLRVFEGGAAYTVPVMIRWSDDTAGSEEPQTVILNVREEPWKVSAFGTVAEAEGGGVLLSVTLVFPEYSNARTFVMRVEEDRLYVQCDEWPHLTALAESFMPSLERGSMGGVVRFVMQQNITKQLMNRTVTPYLSGSRDKSWEGGHEE